ncbi:MAG: RNA methyltransferase [Muribaculaceae bacterium]|nr:RNA methyltransferase [Muribaculaceae bacterium]
MQVINNGIIKQVSSLAVKKYRDKEGLFVAEGWKCVRDTWHAFNCRYLIATKAWYEQQGTAEHYPKLVLAHKSQMARMSQFTTPSDVMAVYEIPEVDYTDDEVHSGLNIVLDNIQDPGNLGTIMRLADWFGIKNIFASKSTVDVYNHKVVQATMGAISRVKVHYCDLDFFLDDFSDMPMLGTFLDGDNIYSAQLPEGGAFVIFGNEGQGISPKVAAHVTQRLHIPAMPRKGAKSESLNVSIAAAITISELRRNMLAK